LLMHLFASPLPEAREYGAMILAELKKTMPSSVARVDNPERGGRWTEYLEERGRAPDRWTARLRLDRARREEDSPPSVRLVAAQGRRAVVAAEPGPWRGRARGSGGRRRGRRISRRA